MDKLKLEFSIPEKYAREITPGYIISFQVDGGKQRHKAKVMATENSVDQNTRTLKVRGVVEEKHPELIPGVFAKVNLQLGKNRQGSHGAYPVRYTHIQKQTSDRCTTG